jgi:hypothetical protein
LVTQLHRGSVQLKFQQIRLCSLEVKVKNFRRRK